MQHNYEARIGALEKKLGELEQMVGKLLSDNRETFTREQGDSNNDMQLVTAAVSKDLMVKMEDRVVQIVEEAALQIADQVYNQITTDINQTIVPTMNKALTIMTYKTEDGDETSLAYRRAVEESINPQFSNLAITDGHVDKRIISQHVRTVFGEDD
jgi:hypothetical protein